MYSYSALVCSTSETKRVTPDASEKGPPQSQISRPTTSAGRKPPPRSLVWLGRWPPFPVLRMDERMFSCLYNPPSLSLLQDDMFASDEDDLLDLLSDGEDRPSVGLAKQEVNKVSEREKPSLLCSQLFNSRVV